MERIVSARMAFKTVAGTKVAMAVAVARNPGYTGFDEELSVTADGVEVPLTELADHHGGPIAAGRPANLCVIDPEVTWTVDGTNSTRPT